MLYDYTPSATDVDMFTTAYIECAAWTHGMTGDDLTDEELANLAEEAKDFLPEHGARLIQAAMYRLAGYTWASAGHDFYLTREGHGAGFWDRGLGMVGDALTCLSKPYGDSDVSIDRYAATMNTPGYSPWSDEPALFVTAREAWEFLTEERARQEDDFASDDGEAYSETHANLTRHAHPEWMVCDFERVGTVYGDTPGYDGDHDLGIAYSVSVYES